jgi:hypothetical protein
MSLGEERLCAVKYVFVPSSDVPVFHSADDFVIHTVTVLHDGYESLHDRVFKACPLGYACMEPLALYHEVLWYHGIRNGENVVLERDDLHHAIDESEYEMLWGRGVAKSPVSICVDVGKAFHSVSSPVCLL